MVYVISKDGQPLMPTNRSGKVRRLLRDKKAKVVKRCPFTIQLLYETTDFVQECTLGVDTGSKHCGAAVYSDGKILYQSQIELRDDIKSKMETKRKCRRFRRNRKTRYRKARFLNRKNSTKLDRLPPSIRSKVNSQIKEIEFVKSILPISQLVLEVGQFDTHLMKDPTINRHWGYQKGPNYGFENTKAKVLYRDNYECQCCKTKKGTLNVHHIIYRSKGGSDEESNLITLCESCHTKLHQGKLKSFEEKLIGKEKADLRYATQMSIVRSQLLKHYPEAIETFGYVTKANRQQLGLPKDHYIDACVIASAGKPFTQNEVVFYKKCAAKQDRQLTKGARGEQSIITKKILGFKKFDKVEYFGGKYFIKGRMSSGYAILMDIFGTKVDFSNLPKGMKTPKLSNCKRITARSSVCISQKIIPNIENRY